MTYFKSTTLVDGYGNDIEGTMLNQLKVANSNRLSGGIFNFANAGDVPDISFWKVTNVAGGTTTVTNSEAINATTTASGSSSILISQKIARYMGANSNYYRSVLRVGDTGAVNNVRQWGAASLDLANGVYFQLSGTTFSIVTKKAGSATAVNSGSFNGQVTSFVMDANYNTYEIYYTSKRTAFVINGVLIHEVSSTTTPHIGTRHLAPYMSNTNTGVGSAVTISAMAMTIARLGEVQSQAKYINIALASTNVIKIGPGFLHQIDINDPGVQTITVYDNFIASGATIAILKPTTSSFGPCLTNIPFDIGLTIVTSNALNVTVVYE